MKRKELIVWFASALLPIGAGWVPPAIGQAPASQQNQAPKPSSEANPFPEDTSNVPVMRNSNSEHAPDVPLPASPAAIPAHEGDPVRSPDEPIQDAESGSADGFSSSSSGLERMGPPPDDDAPAKKRGHKQQAPAERQETAKDDENVGVYYLDQKNWRAALSRFQSALVLDPENPEVYWGLAESQRHLGDLADARANYQKLIEYDPDSKHAREAKKLLKQPEMATAAAIPVK